MDDRTLPRAALLLGCAGLLPAFGALIGLWLAPGAWRQYAFYLGAAYPAIILSFLGGAWWGLASARASRERLPALLTLSICPSLVAVAILLALTPARLALLSLVIGLTPLVDRALAAQGLTPPWWMRLRAPLSTGLSLLTLAVAATTLVRGA